MFRTIIRIFCLAAVLAATPRHAVLALDNPATTRMLVEMSDLSSIAISPDNSHVAFREERASIERNAYEAIWRVQKLEGDAPSLPVAGGGTPLRNGGRIINEPPIWSADAQWIYYRALINGEVQIWRARRDGGRVQQVTRDAADVEAFSIDPDRNRLVYRVGATRDAIARAEQEEYDGGVLFDDSIFAGQGVFRSVFINGRLASERTDERMIRRSLLSHAPKQYRVVDLATLATRDASRRDAQRLDPVSAPPASSGRVRAMVASPGGERRAVLSENAEGRASLRIDDGARDSRRTTCGACEDMKIVSVAWRNDGELIITTRAVARGYAQRLYSWRPDEDRLRLVAEADGLLSGDRSGGPPCAIGGRFAVCVAAEAATPPRLEKIALETGERAVLFEPNVRLAAAARTIDAEFLAWKDDEGRTFTGHLFTPKNRDKTRRTPLFVTYYVCRGFLRGGMGDEWPLIPMAQAGVATLCVNGRLPPRERRDAAADYDAGLAGVTAVVELLDARGLIDPRRVGMGGLSFGGEITLWTAAHSDLLAAASVSSSAASPTWYWFRSMQAGFKDRALDQWGLGPPDETPDRWRLLSPVYYPERFRAPILMQMAEQEYRSAVEYFVRMRRAGAAAELWIYPHEPHIKFQPRHKLSVYGRNLDWFRFWLQNQIDPDPTKTVQYERWNALRDNAPLLQGPSGAARHE